jgi:hypothetical protein
MSYFVLDFGYSHCSIAVVNDDKEEIIKEDGTIFDGKEKYVGIPIAFAYDATKEYIGKEAENFGFNHPECILDNIPLLLSLKSGDKINDGDFNVEIKEEGDTFNAIICGKAFSREEVIKKFFTYISKLINAKTVSNEGVLCIPDETRKNAVNSILEAINKAGLTIKRIIKSSIASIAEADLDIDSGNYLLVIDLCDKLTYRFFNDNCKEVNKVSFDFSTTKIAELLYNQTFTKLRKKFKREISLTDNEKKKLMRYARVAANRILLTDRFEWKVPELTSDIEHVEVLAQTKTFIYLEDIIDNFKDDFTAFLEDKRIDPKSIPYCILTNLAINVPYTFEFINEDNENIENAELEYCISSLKGAIKISKDSSKYPTVSTELKEIPIGGEKILFGDGIIEMVESPKPSPSKVAAKKITKPVDPDFDDSDDLPKPSPSKVAAKKITKPIDPDFDDSDDLPKPSPSKVAAKKKVKPIDPDFDDSPLPTPSSKIPIEVEDPTTIDSIPKMKNFLSKLTKFINDKSDSKSVRPAYIKTANFQINNARNFIDENPSASADEIKEFCDPIIKQIQRLFKDWRY